MTDERRDASRLALARMMLDALPRFGHWADSMREFETPFGAIGYRQAAILWVLRYQLLPPDEMTPTGFANFFRIQPSVVTRALAKLECGGYIARTIDPQDTRVSRIAITPAGHAISVHIERLYVDDLLCALAPIDDAEIDQLQASVELLSSIAERLDLLHLGRTQRAPSGDSER